MTLRLFLPILSLPFATIVGISVSQALAREEHEIGVGRNSAGQIRVKIDFAQPLEFPVSIFPGISGYANSEPAFHSTILDEPANDFFQLSPATDFRFVLLAKDPGMEVWNDTGSAFLQIGEAFYIGSAPFDNHPIWNLVNGTAGKAYSLTLKLRDLNGVYSDSSPFVLAFTPIQTVIESVPLPINITRVDSQNAMLRWSTNAAGWNLQSITSTAGTNWQKVTKSPEIAGTNFFLNMAIGETQQFFRLSRQ